MTAGSGLASIYSHSPAAMASPRPGQHTSQTSNVTSISSATSIQTPSQTSPATDTLKSASPLRLRFFSSEIRVAHGKHLGAYATITESGESFQSTPGTEVPTISPHLPRQQFKIRLFSSELRVGKKRSRQETDSSTPSFKKAKTDVGLNGTATLAQGSVLEDEGYTVDYEWRMQNLKAQQLKRQEHDVKRLLDGVSAWLEHDLARVRLHGREILPTVLLCSPFQSLDNSPCVTPSYPKRMTRSATKNSVHGPRT